MNRLEQLRLPIYLTDLDGMYQVIEDGSHRAIVRDDIKLLLKEIDAAEADLDTVMKSRQAVVDELTAAEARNRELTDALTQIRDWADAYPKKIFREPDFEEMQRVLSAAGYETSMTAAHGTWARHLTDGIGDIARKALGEQDGE